MTKRAKPALVVADYGSDLAHHHNVVKPELTGRGHAVRMRVKDGCELDRLWLKGLLTEGQHSAGVRFAGDLHAARLLGLVTINFGGTGGGGGSITDAHADAFSRVGDAIRALDKIVGEVGRAVTLTLCLSQARLAREAVPVARGGLETLLAHYGRHHLAVGLLPAEADLLA